MVDNAEFLKRIEKLEKQVELLQAEITAIKNIEVSEKAREQIDKMEQANKLVKLMENLSEEKMTAAHKDDELEILQNVSQQAEAEIQSSINTIEQIIENAADESDFEWRNYEDGVEITKYVGFDEAVVIPEFINSFPVIKIGDNVFLNCKEVKHIVLPNNLCEFGRGVFKGSGLKQIKIPSNIKRLSFEAFRGCRDLEKVQLSENLEYIDSYAFYGCSKLLSVDFPNGVKYIGFNAFYGCENLSYVNLSNSLERIEDHAFCGCEKLSYVNLPRSLKRIGDEVFKETKIDTIVFKSDISFGNHVVSYKSDRFRGLVHTIKVAFWGKDDIIQYSSFWGSKYIFYCLPGSSAQRYARENGIEVKHLREFENDTKGEK